MIRGDECHSVVVYATNEDVRARRITYTQNNIGLGDELVYPDIELRNNGPMKWSPQISNGDKLALALFTNTGLVYLTVSANDASILDRTTHDLDGRWDTISGTVWDFDDDFTPRLHISSLVSTLQCPTAVLEFSPKGPISLKSPNWRDQIENNLVLFSVKNDLKGNSKAKVWGLTASPLGDFIAACNSVHPSDMIEYGPPADRRGTVAISTLRQYNQIRRGFPAKNVSAEGVLFTLKKLVDNTVEDADQIPDFVEEMVGKLMQAYAPLPSSQDTSDTLKMQESSDLHALVEEFKMVAFLDPHTLKDRYTILVSRACNVTDSVDLFKTLIAYRLACTSQSRISKLAQTPFSAEILAQHRQVVSTIHALTEPDATEAESTTENEPTPERTSHSSSSAANATSPHSAFAVIATDTCDFCSAPIPFTDLTTAACTNGHQFPRCQLTFLAIQAPGITKYCGICNTPFLSDEFVAAQERRGGKGNADEDLPLQSVEDAEKVPPEQQERVQKEGTETICVDGVREEAHQDQTQQNGPQEPPHRNGATKVPSAKKEGEDSFITLAQVLFLACDVCIYCGGKYVG